MQVVPIPNHGYLIHLDANEWFTHQPSRKAGVRTVIGVEVTTASVVLRYRNRMGQNQAARQPITSVDLVPNMPAIVVELIRQLRRLPTPS